MFWGLIIEPNTRYAQVVEKPFHVCQAAIDISTGDNEPCQVMVVVDGKNFLVCTLQVTKSVQVPLNLYFKKSDSIAFLTNGKCNIHLTGYLDTELEELSEDVRELSENESELSEDESELSEDKSELSKDESELSVDEPFSTDSSLSSSELSEDEEEEEEEKEEEVAPSKNKRKHKNKNDASANKKAKKTKKKAAADLDSDDNEDQLQELYDEEEQEEADSDDDSDYSTVIEDTSLDTSKEAKNLSKSQRRRLKKKLQRQGKKQPQANGVVKPKNEKKASQNGQTAVKKVKKTSSGGVLIEDTKVGAGAPAKPGKQVVVYYEGRLQSNNKMFNKCLKGPGYEFKLGAKEVISGWDEGISGMKVGGKRRIVCPPSMAYGARGSPPMIPPNSTLVFNIELKKVK